MARFYDKDRFRSVLGQPELGMRDLSPDSGRDNQITRHIVNRPGRKEELRGLPEKPLLPPTPKKPVKVFHDSKRKFERQPFFNDPGRKKDAEAWSGLQVDGRLSSLGADRPGSRPQIAQGLPRAPPSGVRNVRGAPGTSLPNRFAPIIRAPKCRTSPQQKQNTDSQAKNAARDRPGTAQSSSPISSSELLPVKPASKSKPSLHATSSQIAPAQDELQRNGRSSVQSKVAQVISNSVSTSKASEPAVFRTAVEGLRDEQEKLFNRQAKLLSDMARLLIGGEIQDMRRSTPVSGLQTTGQQAMFASTLSSRNKRRRSPDGDKPESPKPTKASQGSQKRSMSMTPPGPK